MPQRVNLCCWFHLRIASMLWKIASFRLSYRNQQNCTLDEFSRPPIGKLLMQHIHIRHSLQCSYPILTIECNDAYRHPSMHHKFFHRCYCFNFQMLCASVVGAQPLESAVHAHTYTHAVIATDFSTKSEIDIGLSDIYCYCCEKSILKATKKYAPTHSTRAA